VEADEFFLERTPAGCFSSRRDRVGPGGFLETDGGNARGRRTSMRRDIDLRKWAADAGRLDPDNANSREGLPS
jgi:hypothetical protein